MRRLEKGIYFGLPSEARSKSTMQKKRTKNKLFFVSLIPSCILQNNIKRASGIFFFLVSHFWKTLNFIYSVFPSWLFFLIWKSYSNFYLPPFSAWLLLCGTVDSDSVPNSKPNEKHSATIRSDGSLIS